MEGGIAVRAIKMLFLTASILGLIPRAAAFAAPADVHHFAFRGSVAEGAWLSRTDTSFTFTYVNAMKTRTDQELFVDQDTEYFDNGGNFIGDTDTFVDVPNGFSFTTDAGKLSAASVSGSHVPGTTCSYDANFDLIGCTGTAVDVSVTWTGYGPIGRGTFHDQFHSDGFTFSDHFQGMSRKAVASGTVGGRVLTTDDLGFADMLRSNFGGVDICIGC
ncbi:MAG TPA: hypothetical protein VF968_08305 [Actinomycetota bacterium]